MKNKITPLSEKIRNNIYTLCLTARDTSNEGENLFIQTTEHIEKNIKQAIKGFCEELKKGKIGNITHRNSCGEPIKDEIGETVICCGDDLGGLDDEFAQCERCRFNDFIDEAKLKHFGEGLIESEGLK